MIDIYNTMCILGIICMIAFIFYVYIGKKNFDSKTQKMIADKGIVFNKQSKTEHGIIGTDKSRRELIMIRPGKLRPKMVCIPYDDITACELIVDADKTSAIKETIEELELMIISKSKAYQLQMFTFLSKKTNEALINTRIEQAQMWKKIIRAIIVTRRDYGY